MQKSIERSHRPARAMAGGPLMLSQADVAEYAALAGIGININNGFVRRATAELLDGFGMDGNNVGISPAPISGLTTPSIAVQIQFLQNWLPGFVRVLTAARKIDDIIGLTTSGAWEDEEVIFGIMEGTGVAEPYTDIGNIPLASWNTNWERRTVVRFEKGISVGMLEEARAARMRINTAGEKRGYAALALDVQRNRVGFYGYNDGANRTFGFLNDPNLPAYVAVPNGASGSSTWASKSFLEITADLRIGASFLRTNSKEVIDPTKAAITLAVATKARESLTVMNVQGTQSVNQWIKENYPNWRIESAPELDDANGGAAVFYLFAESVDDGASDNSRVFDQVVPSKFYALGVEKRAKSYVEDYSNATAGVITKRPYGVYRGTGI